jgi:DNA-directed RNA polymerase I, II, and III subunit RPABC2
MPRPKTTNIKSKAKPRSKSVDYKETTIIKEVPTKKINIELENIPEDEDELDVDIDADEDEFFDEKNFENINPHIQYNIYDPEKYVNELHKEIVVVPDNFRRTSEVITKYEYTDVTSNRAKQIEDGSPIFTDIKGESDPIKMAELEIRMKRCPLSVRRMISNNICEIWDVNEMIIPY